MPGRITYYSFIVTYYSSNSFIDKMTFRDQWHVMTYKTAIKSEVHDFLWLLSLVDGKLHSSSLSDKLKSTEPLSSVEPLAVI